MRSTRHDIGSGWAIWIVLGVFLLFGITARAEQIDPETQGYLGNMGTKDLGPRGERVIPSLDFSDASLTDVLRAIAKFSGLNIVASHNVQGSVSVFLKDVTVRSALNAILGTNGYSYIHRDNVVYILPASALGEDTVKLITRVYFLQYLDAEEVANSLTSKGGGSGSSGQQQGASAGDAANAMASFMTDLMGGGESAGQSSRGGGSRGGGGGSGAGGSSNGNISFNKSANAIIITDTPEEVERVVAILDELDRPFKQVQIEARLIELRLTDDFELGIDWFYFNQDSPENRGDVNLAPLDRSTGLAEAAGMFQFGWLGSAGEALNGFIQAMEQQDKMRILANPIVAALHNTTAQIRITNDIPYVEANVSQGVITESVSFKETGITLEVTPRINDQRDITMRIKPIQRIAGPRIILQNSNAFPVDERSAETELRVPDASTIVIGGLRSSETEKTLEKVPVLGDIPLLGNAFKRRLDKVVQTDLLLFVTPTIVKDYQLTPREEDRYDEFERLQRTLERNAQDIRIEEQRREEKEIEKQEKQLENERKRREKKLSKQKARLEKELEAEAVRMEWEKGEDHGSQSQSTGIDEQKTQWNWEGDWALESNKENVETVVSTR